MKKILIPMLMITIFASTALASQLTQDGSFPDLARESNWLADRIGLVSDGSFEDGPCGAGSGWTCSSTSACGGLVVDLAAAGLWNYHGDAVAYLGGFCQGISDVSESVCQDILIDGDILSWYWMVFVNDGGQRVRATIDGIVVHEYFISLADHLAGYAEQTANIGAFLGGVHTVCFEYELISGTGDNYFLDYVTLDSSVATEEASFSTVKSMY